MVWLWLVAACWLPGQVLAQSPGPDGGTLSPATSTVCSGFNSGTLTLTGYTGSILKYQANSGSGYVDIANTSPTYTFSNLTQTTSFRAVVQNGTNAAVTSTVATVTVNQPPTATINSQGPTRFCQQGTIYLVAGPSGNFTYQFLRNGINIAGATNQVYTATISKSGSYSVRVTDAAGCSAVSASIQIQVQPQNVVNLNTNTPTTFCQGGSVLLSANVSGSGAANYTYQFLRDGNQIPGATNSTYSATTSGTYRVVVNNPAICSSTSNAVTVTVTPPTVATLSYPAASYCQSGATNPTATATPTGGTFSSTAGLSLNTNTGTINLAQSQPGTYSVAYTSGGSCPGTATANVTITAPPTAGFSYAAGSRCAGTTGTLTSTLAPGATAGSYSASPAGLSLNASTGAINLGQSKAGSYTVTNTVAAANGCAAVSAMAPVVLTAQPVATLAAGGATTFCQGGSVVLTASGGAAGATYQFLRNGQPISGATNATYTATASGSYSVVITNLGGCASTSAPTSVMVNPTTTATFSYSAAAFCQNSGTTPTPTITGTMGGAFSSAPAGLSGNASTGAINLAASTPGTYTVTYSVGGPCPSTGTQTVTIRAPAVATFNYSSSSYCATGTTAATLATGSAAGTFSSTTGLSVNATTGAVNLAASTPGTYTVTNTVAASGGCAAVLATATLTINALPAQPTLTASGTVLTASAAPGATYQFFLNGVAIAGATSATYTVTQNGSYTVVTTNAAGCASLPSAPLSVVLTATRAGLVGAELTVFPNPTTGRLTVTMSGSHSRARLAVYNALGQEMLAGTMAASAATAELDLTTLATGVYVLKVTSTEGSVTRRVVRQ